MEIHVFLVGGDICRSAYGNGVVFVDSKNKAIYDRKCNYVYTKEPSILSRLIKRLTTNKVDNRILPLLFIVDRFLHLISLAPYKHHIIVMDRYKYSNMAYQGSYILNMVFPNADVFVYLNVPISISLKRISKRKDIYAFERKNVLVFAKKRFLSIIHQIKNKTKVFIVDEVENGRIKSIGEVQKEIFNYVFPIVASYKQKNSK